MSWYTNALCKELIRFCRSESLSENGLREIFERYGCEPNNNLEIEKYDFFIVACCNGSVTEGILRYLLEYFPDTASATTSRGYTPLQYMCFNKNATLGMVQLLVDASPESLRRADNDGCTPLHTLCSNRDLDDTAAVDVLGLLLERCPEAARCVNNKGRLPIHLAVAQKSLEFCRMLIEAYPGSERMATSKGTLPLHIACRLGAAAAAEYLYKLYPESIDVADRQGAHPIHYAVKGLRSRIDPAIAAEMVQFRLDRDPNLAMQKFHGRFPLVIIFNIACNNRNNPSKFNAALKILHLLYDAHPEVIEDNGITSNIDRRDILLPREVQTFIDTQLNYARQARDSTLMKKRDENGQVPLHRALRDDVILGSIKLLVKGNPSAVLITDNDGSLPLHVAIQHHDSTKVVDYLIGLDPNTLTAVDDWEGNTALHHACRCAKYDTIALLLKKYNAVSISKTNENNRLPIHLLLESNVVASREDDTEYMESIFRLLRAYPDTVMI